MSSLLSVRDLKVHYQVAAGAVHAVDGATFDVPEGQVVGLVGESGCGKTTMARAITGVMAKTARVAGGEILFGGRNIAGLPRREMVDLLWRDISFIPQSAMNSLDPVYRVERQLLEVLLDRGGMDKRSARLRAAELFEMVGLDPRRLRDFPHQFSGGMRQRAAIALALALNPKLIIADEPVTALDVIVQRQILDTIRDLQSQLGLSVILVTHDISVVAYICDQVVVMYAGRVAESGPTDAVLTRPYHPYTMGLYNAFPDLERSGETLVPIEGAPPNLLDPPGGCLFAPRCPFAQSACTSWDPVYTNVEDNHVAACLRANEADTLRAEAGRIETWTR